MNNVTARSITLHSASGGWLGQIVLTSDGAFTSVTDYGNLSYAWRSFGDKSFEDFILSLNTQYFGGKLYSGMSYIVHSEKVEKACMRYAEMILPALQKFLLEEKAAATQPAKPVPADLSIKEGTVIICKNIEPLPGNKIAPTLELDKEYIIKTLFKCHCGEEHVDVGLPLEINYVECHKCRETLPPIAHWCHSSRFVMNM